MTAILNRTAAWAVSLLLLAFSGGAHAGAVLQVDASGILTGATGVNVDGTLYDVVFVDGTCAALFDGCVAVHPTNDKRINALQALLDQVLLDDPATGDLFDSNPSLIRGCTDTLACSILLPILVDIPRCVAQFQGDCLEFKGFAANNLNPINGMDSVGFYTGTPPTTPARLFDTTNAPDATYAVFTPSLNIPEPGTLALAAASGLGMLGLRRRGRGRQRHPA